LNVSQVADDTYFSSLSYLSLDLCLNHDLLSPMIHIRSSAAGFDQTQASHKFSRTAAAAAVEEEEEEEDGISSFLLSPLLRPGIISGSS
jgi:hypothetical protein